MGLYAERILPWLIDHAMRHEGLAAYRARVVVAACGRVLEIGIGSGLNLPHYGDCVDQLIGLDPSPRLLAAARKRGGRYGSTLHLLEASAASIPLEAASVDAVVMTWSLCSIPDPPRALAEMRRVLRPGGALHFVEHGRSPDRSVAAWQARLTPAWQRLAGGCHLDRDVEGLLRASGFALTELRRGYLPTAPRLFGFMYEGRAQSR